MPIIQKTLIIKWNAKTKNYYEEKGYIFTTFKDEFEVKIRDLHIGSKEPILCQCEYCNKEFKRIFSRAIAIYNKKLESERKMCCPECKKYKIEDVNLEKHGYKYPFQSKEVLQKTKESCFNNHGVYNPFQASKTKDKIKQTWIEKYGVDNPAKSEIIQDKIKQTNLKIYGHDNPWKCKEIKDKIRQTWIKKYGFDHPMKNKEYKEAVLTNVKKSNLKKYGYELPLQSPEIRLKCLSTLCNNNKIAYSRQQKYICDIFSGKLNYQVDNVVLDIAFPDKMLYIEYDGSGHNLSFEKFGMDKDKFKQKEINRQYYLKSLGWKLIRIISRSDLLPDSISLQKLIDTCKNNIVNSSWIILDIDNKVIYNNDINIKINYKFYKLDKVNYIIKKEIL